MDKTTPNSELVVCHELAYQLGYLNYESRPTERAIVDYVLGYMPTSDRRWLEFLLEQDSALREIVIQRQTQLARCPTWMSFIECYRNVDTSGFCTRGGANLGEVEWIDALSRRVSELRGGKSRGATTQIAADLRVIAAIAIGIGRAPDAAPFMDCGGVMNLGLMLERSLSEFEDQAAPAEIIRKWSDCASSILEVLRDGLVP